MKCEICGNEFENFHAQGFDHKIYCPLCYFKKANQKLKKQLEDKTEDYKRMKDNFDIKVDVLTKIETQQKEFIEYMNKTIKELECDDVDDEEMKGYLIQRIDTFKEILSKYKEIIGDDK
ncbi:MAG: hypothetical protein MSA15_19815 [Clostridium sp.]|nr:hypothetical protein [Clostridium sp.]